MSKFDALDTAILKELSGRSGMTFEAIRGKLEDMANPLATPDTFGIRHGWRLIDRRLQALRKRGMIAPHRARGWHLIPKGDTTGEQHG